MKSNPKLLVLVIVAIGAWLALITLMGCSPVRGSVAVKVEETDIVRRGNRYVKVTHSDGLVTINEVVDEDE